MLAIVPAAALLRWNSARREGIITPTLLRHMKLTPQARQTMIMIHQRKLLRSGRLSSAGAATVFT